MNESKPLYLTQRTTHDLELMRRVSHDRDSDAYDALLRKYSSLLFSLIRTICTDPVSAEDALQETMLAVWTRACTFDPDLRRGSVRNWLTRIAAHKALGQNTRRRRERARVNRKRLEVKAAAGDVSAENVGYAEQTELLNATRRLLSGMPDFERSLLALYYGSALSQQEIAQKIGMPQRTVSKRLQRAVAGLRQELNKAGFAGLALEETDIWSAAVLSGHQMPDGLFEKLLGFVHEASGKSAPIFADYLKFKIFVVAGVLGATLLMGAAYFRNPDVQNESVPAINAEEPSAAVHPIPLQATGFINEKIATPSSNTLPRVWTFEKGLPMDFIVDERGRNCWSPATMNRPAALSARGGRAQEIKIGLPVIMPKRPVKCVVKGVLNRPLGEFLIAWNGEPFVSKVRTQHVRMNSAHCEVTCYIFDQYILRVINGTLHGIGEFSSAYPRDKILFRFHGMDIHRIEIVEINEVPKKFWPPAPPSKSKVSPL